ncbi:MAG TPA: NAD(P)/FAD-dependent oxidoreductase [Firmicutes bacterium]|nr:NAD(P)/FAD-dependent oxidoreductase [Bacillota bacterium]
MTQSLFKYTIIGGGLAGVSAIDGIREIDKDGAILLIGRESHLPYHRPPLSKKLWTGKKKVEEIFVRNHEYFDENNVELSLGTEVTGLDISSNSIFTIHGKVYRYEKLLLATGGESRTLDIPGGDHEGLIYFRHLDDYLRSTKSALEGRSALIIGGGFIGTEMAAALHGKNVDVTMIFPGGWFCRNVFPENLGKAIQDEFIAKGIKVFPGDKPASIEEKNDRFFTKTANSATIASDFVVLGIGLKASTELAENSGLETSDGIMVNDRLRTSDPDIYSAGDNTNFPYIALGKRMRIEHWDNALNQGIHAGRNMAGADKPYDYMPYFFSDLFDFGYEAVGDIDASLETLTNWKEENKTGIIYYAERGKVRGMMMCNVWDKVDTAREIIREETNVAIGNLPDLGDE